jgi:cytochrome P450
MTHPVPVPRGLPMERDAGPFDPPRRVSRLRETHPVSPLVFPDGHEGWLVTGYEAVRRLLADTRFSSRQDLGALHVPYETPGMPSSTGPSPQVPGLFIGMDPPEQTRLRRMLIGAFTVRRMKQIEHQIIDITERQLDEVVRLTPPVDLVTVFALPVPSLVICELLGVPYEDRATFQTNSNSFLSQESSLKAKMSAYVVLSMYLTELVARKRAVPGDDILSDLARRDDLTIEELTGIGFLLLLVGHNSTANTLALSAFALLQHPEHLAELRADPELLPAAVEELLRYVSQADIFLRYATEDIELCGETIGKGSTVVVSLRAANRDPLRFENPDVLDFHRTPRGHLSFGHGVHQCLGHELVRIEIRAALGGLLRRFLTVRLAVPVGDVRFTTDMRNHAVHELPVTWGDGAV